MQLKQWLVDILFGRVLTQLFVVQEIIWLLYLKIAKWENFTKSEASDQRNYGNLFCNFTNKKRFQKCVIRDYA